MKVNKLYLKNFRNISESEIFPQDEINVICGENAQGKTNIIEALWLFSGAKSFRGSKDFELIKKGEKSALISTDFTFLGVKNEAQIKISDKKTAFLNEKELSSASKLAGNFNAVIFSPVDLELVKGGPQVRRKFLDLSIGQIYPNYIEILKSYKRAVMQRNTIIKDLKYDKTVEVMLDIFEKEIAISGEKIIKYRKNYIEDLKNYLPEIYSGLSGGREQISAVYVANCEDNIEKNLKESRKEDMYTGVTSVGPHRDNITFLINGDDSRSFGSQGQQRSVSLSLKLSQAEVAKEITGEQPICLLDDVMSELDVTRQNYILNHIKGRQAFITCCDPSNTARLKEGKIYTVKNGEVLN